MCRAIVAIVLCLALSVTPAFAETVAEPLQGLITEVQTGFFLMQDETSGIVRVNLDDEQTVYAGIAAKDTLTVGQYVLVEYNGVITRGDPPQVTATKVSCFALTGSVTEVLQSGVLLEGDQIIPKAIVHIGEGFPPVYLGMQVTVYYGGVMALSMPPQVDALHIVVPVLEGTAGEVSDTGFTLCTSGGGCYVVSVNENTRMSTLLSEGLAVRVYYSGTSGEAITALAVAPLQDVQTDNP